MDAAMASPYAAWISQYLSRNKISVSEGVLLLLLYCLMVNILNYYLIFYFIIYYFNNSFHGETGDLKRTKPLSSD